MPHLKHNHTFHSASAPTCHPDPHQTPYSSFCFFKSGLFDSPLSSLSVCFYCMFLHFLVLYILFVSFYSFFLWTYMFYLFLFCFFSPTTKIIFCTLPFYSLPTHLFLPTHVHLPNNYLPSYVFMYSFWGTKTASPQIAISRGRFPSPLSHCITPPSPAEHPNQHPHTSPPHTHSYLPPRSPPPPLPPPATTTTSVA